MRPHSTRWPGSSPRARGTLAFVGGCSGGRRFIPAGAGNTPRHNDARLERAVHPRGRGEHLLECRHATPSAGSSPRARGTLFRSLSRMGGRRFIPAGAGNTGCIRRTLLPASVHPRGRGEHPNCSVLHRRWAGSSPRARGTQRQRAHRALAGARFIPAGAGNTHDVVCELHRRAVHPRGRGEHDVEAVPRQGVAGSSPRARGTQGLGGGEGGGARFIPAGAGNTASLRWPSSASPVHPRGRGEHGRGWMPGDRFGGSSPRARGTRAGGVH